MSTVYITYDIPAGKMPVRRRTELLDLTEALANVGENWRGFILRQDETDRCITCEVVARSEGK